MSKHTDVPTVLAMPLSEAILTIDTRDGLRADASGFIIEPNNPFDINIYKGTNFVNGAIRRIAIKEINLPLSIPNVNPRNFGLYIDVKNPDESITQYDVFVDTGFYTGPVLQTAVQGALNVDGGVGNSTNWEVEYNVSTGRFSINNPDVDFRINPKIGVYLPGEEETTLAEMMGFQTAGKEFANSIIGSYASLLYTTYIDIVSTIITKNQDVRDSSTSVRTGQDLLARIYIAPQAYTPINTEGSVIGSTPFHLHYQWQQPKILGWNADESLPTFRIQLRDDKGQVLYVPDPTTEFFEDPKLMQCGNTAFCQITLTVSEALNR